MTADDPLVIAPDRDLGLDDWAGVVDGGRPVRIEDATLAAMDRAFQVAVQRAASERTYGVGTGFGPMIRVDIPPEEVETLQYNLVRSHAMGMGRPYSPRLSRGVLLTRLQNQARNRSAVRSALPSLAAALLNAGIAPWIPRKGGVGASGDLVQLAPLGRLFIGEGPCWSAGPRR